MSKIRDSDLINDIKTNIQYKNLPNEKQLESSSDTQSRYESTKISIGASDRPSLGKKFKISSVDERNYGNFSCYFFYKNDPLIVVGPDWCYYVLLSSFTFASFSIIFIYYKNNFTLYTWLIGVLLYITHMTSYIMAVFKNPGIPSNNYYKDSLINQGNYDCCTLCKSVINLDSQYITYHCNDCNLCIEGYDHHCPWTTKCIGKGNLKSFYVFVASTLSYIIYMFFAIAQIKKF